MKNKILLLLIALLPYNALAVSSSDFQLWWGQEVEVITEEQLEQRKSEQNPPSDKKRNISIELEGVNWPIFYIIGEEWHTYTPGENNLLPIPAEEKTIFLYFPLFETTKEVEVDWKVMVKIDLSEENRLVKTEAVVNLREEDEKYIRDTLLEKRVNISGHNQGGAKFNYVILWKNMKEAWKIKNICYLNRCPKFLTIDNGMYQLNIESGEYNFIKETKVVENDNADNSVSNNRKGNLWVIIISVILLLSISGLAVLFFRRKH